MTVHQLIFSTDDGALGIVQGTCKEDVFKDGYARYLSMHNPVGGTWTTSGFYNQLITGGLIELSRATVTIDADYNVFIRYNTFTKED